VSIQTEVTTYRFTLPESGEATTIGSAAAVVCQVHVRADGGVELELSNFYRPGATVALSLEQFNQLRAKVFEVTGKVV
jgi:hypothetical protein